MRDEKVVRSSFKANLSSCKITFKDFGRRRSVFTIREQNKRKYVKALLRVQKRIDNI